MFYNKIYNHVILVACLYYCSGCTDVDLLGIAESDEIFEIASKKDQTDFFTDVELEDDDYFLYPNPENVGRNITIQKNKRVIQMKPLSKKACPHYKNGADLDMKNMADVWQSFYYDMVRPVGCFKILIEAIDEMNKKDNIKMYGTFNGKVNWDMCNLEIKSNHLMRKHFLQGDGRDGVMENIIIVEDYDEGNFTIVEEVADQWLLVNNMLLLRDCETGHIVAFYRIPYKPNDDTLLRTLKLFGETETNGRLACDYDNDVEFSHKFQDSEYD